VAAVVTWARVDLVAADGRAVTTASIDGPCDGAPDLAVVDVLARWELAARYAGMQLRVRDACRELRELLAFVDLDWLVVDPPP